MLHEGGEVFAGDETELSAGVGEGGEGVRLVADEAGEPEERAGDGIDRNDGLGQFRNHGECDVTRVEDVETGGELSLAKEDALFVAGNEGGFLLERLEQFRIGYESGGVELQLGISKSEWHSFPLITRQPDGWRGPVGATRLCWHPEWQEVVMRITYRCLRRREKDSGLGGWLSGHATGEDDLRVELECGA